MAHFLFAKESGYTPSGAEIYFVNSDPAGDAGNSLQEWPSWVLACSYSSHSCFLCLWCGGICFLMLPSLQWKSYYLCLLALPSSRCARRVAHLHVCSPTGSRLNQLSSADRSTMAHSVQIREQGTTLSLWQSYQCLSKRAVGWQQSGTLNTSILQRMVTSLLDQVGMLQWSAAGSCFEDGRVFGLLLNDPLGVTCPRSAVPGQSQEETEKHSHLFFFTLYPILRSSVSTTHHGCS